MAKPKFDYNSDVFYQEIYLLANNGLTDAEISDALTDKFKQTLTPAVFSKMKNGKYEGWSKRDNKIRSEKISQALSRARRKVNATIRRRFIDIALGGKKIKSTSTITRKIKASDGTLTELEGIQITETENELPPNLQALSTWLINHDPEWGKSTNGEIDEEDGSIAVSKWITENTE